MTLPCALAPAATLGDWLRSQRSLLRRTLGIIYEDFRLLNDRSVFENIALAVRITGHSRDDEVIPRVLYALEEVGLQHRQAQFPQELSAGERQRAAIARAIVNRPAVLLADEPTGALDSATSVEIMSIFQRLNDEGLTILLVTHELDVAEHARRIVTFKDGLILSDEPVARRRIAGRLQEVAP